MVWCPESVEENDEERKLADDEGTDNDGQGFSCFKLTKKVDSCDGDFVEVSLFEIRFSILRQYKRLR